MDEENMSVDMSLRGANNRMERNVNASPVIDDMQQHRRELTRTLESMSATQGIQDTITARSDELIIEDFNIEMARPEVARPSPTGEITRWMMEDEIKEILSNALYGQIRDFVESLHPNATVNSTTNALLSALLAQIREQLKVVANSIAKKLLNTEIEINGRKRKVILSDEEYKSRENSRPQPQRRTNSSASYAGVASDQSIGFARPEAGNSHT